MYSLAGKWALVSGGGSGIGRRVALRFAKAGARVVAMDVDGAGLQETVRLSEGAVAGVEGDVRSEAAWGEAVIEAGGRVNILVNNAAVCWRGDALTSTLEHWNTIIGINLTGAFLGVQAVLPGMFEAGEGVIINIGSVNIDAPGKNLLPYSASKGGLLTLTRQLATEYAEKRIRVNIVNPGWVHTEGEQKLQVSLGRPEDHLDRMGQTHPFGRLIRPEEIAEMVLFLASDAGQMISGQEFNVYLRGKF